MGYLPFYQLCQETAESETRCVMIRNIDNEFNLPLGDYFFTELYCNECDCRRVFFAVICDNEPVANITFGWESIAYYQKNFKGFSKQEIIDLKGPELDMFQYQSKIAPNVFEMFKKILFTDKDYMKRIEAHYKQFKTALKQKTNK